MPDHISPLSHLLPTDGPASRAANAESVRARSGADAAADGNGEAGEKPIPSPGDPRVAAPPEPTDRLAVLHQRLQRLREELGPAFADRLHQAPEELFNLLVGQYQAETGEPASAIAVLVIFDLLLEEAQRHPPRTGGSQWRFPRGRSSRSRSSR
jgi:hypothetical protein